jgi:CNT family concentrative nucleoside transporter
MVTPITAARADRRTQMPSPGEIVESLRGVPGIVVLLLLAWACSEDRQRINWRTVVGGLALQLVLAVLLLRLPAASHVLLALNAVADAAQRASDAGSGFVFGYLGGSKLPFAETVPGASYILAFRALPLVLIISAASAVLFHWGVLQRVMGAFAWLLRRSLGIDGALALGAAVHIFVGNIEAPLLVRPYLARMQRGELFALMTCGMAGVAGTVMVIYASFLAAIVPDSLATILIASVISTPAALAVAALMVPFGPGEPGAKRFIVTDPPLSTLDAFVKGTLDGIGPLAAIIAVLIVTIATVTLLNMALGELPPLGGAPVSLQSLAAWLFRPVVWLIGIPWAESATASSLMGTKTVLNEFVAYLDLAHLPPGALSPHSARIMTYAMCGFANFGSLGIMLGGMGAMVPERRHELVRLGLRTILSGTIATCLSGAWAGMLVA